MVRQVPIAWFAGLVKLRASCKIPSSGIGFGRAVDFTGFEGQKIAAPSIGGRGKDMP